MINLYLHSLSFTHSHEYIYSTKMSAVIFAVTQQFLRLRDAVVLLATGLIYKLRKVMSICRPFL